MKKAQELQEMEKKLALNMDIIKYFTLAWKSKLSVISSLAKKKRVQSDIVRPFIVYTPDDEQVEVLGTKFYVEAYSGTKKFETALIEIGRASCRERV